MRKQIIGIVFLLILLMTACSQKEEVRSIELKPYTLTELAKMDFTGVDRITIKDGSTGEEREFTDQAKIKNWLQSMDAAYFTPDINQEKREGWTYWITLYEGKKEVFEFYPNNINDIYFKPDEKVMENIEELYNAN